MFIKSDKRDSHKILFLNLLSFLVLSFYVSMQLFKPTQFSIFGFNLSIYDFTFLFWSAIVIVSYRYVKISFRYISPYMYLIGVFVIIANIQVLNSQEPLKAFTLFIQLLRDIGLMILTIFAIKFMNIQTLNKQILFFGFYLAYFFLFLYAIFLLYGFLPFPIFEYGEFQSIRFGGFAIDANFYAYLMSLPLFIIYFNKNLSLFYRFILYIPISVSIIITISRSVIAALILVFIVSILLFERKFLRIVKYIVILLFITICLTFLSHFQLPGLSISIYEWYELRATQNTPRFEYWQVLLNAFIDNPIFGYGLRGSEILLGGMGEYAHSSYIELLIDYGLFGSIIFLCFMFYVFFIGLKLVQMSPLYKPWVSSYMMLCILFGGFTLLYWPFFWIVIGIILGGYQVEKNRFNNNFI